MTKVYFHLQASDELILDREGAEYADLATAKRDAEIGLQELIVEDIRNCRPVLERSIHLEGDNGESLAHVKTNLTKIMRFAGH